MRHTNAIILCVYIYIKMNEINTQRKQNAQKVQIKGGKQLTYSLKLSACNFRKL